MEELLIQRQKRIAAKSSNGSSSVSSPLASKKTPPGGTKTVKKEKTPEAVTQSKAKPVLRSSTIERLAVARTAPPKEPQQKPVNKRTTSKPVVGSKTEKPQDKKPSRKLSRDPSLEIKETVEEEESQSYLPVKQADELPLPAASSSVDDDFKDIKEMMHSLPNEETITNHQHKVEEDQTNEEIVKMTSVCEDKQVTRDICSEDAEEAKDASAPKPLSPKKSVTFSETNMEEKYFFSPTVSETDVSTPPATEAADHSRKKWNSEETSPKATAKVFRKLLMFGRKK